MQLSNMGSGYVIKQQVVELSIFAYHLCGRNIWVYNRSFGIILIDVSQRPKTRNCLSEISSSATRRNHSLRRLIEDTFQKESNPRSRSNKKQIQSCLNSFQYALLYLGTIEAFLQLPRMRM